ncbi:MAG: hypothetical protein K0U98_25000 [Deltaproteobacteria bacterium]|nr:hypothetical protein [Deltaproteobacteria bacterium]
MTLLASSVTLGLCYLLVGTSPLGAQESMIQSVMNTKAPPDPRYDEQAEKVALIEGYSHFFTGSEIGNYTISGVGGASGRREVRRTSEAMRQAEANTGRPFLGYFHFPRLPGFFYDQELNEQPEQYRSLALRSDGTAWPKRPVPSCENESLIAVTGDHLDITYQPAVNELLANVARVFDQDCEDLPGGQEGDCIGPIHGYILLDEYQLRGRYRGSPPCDPKNPQPGEPCTCDVTAFADVFPNGGSTKIRSEGATTGSTHIDLYVDDDHYYSFYQPPLRTLSLFSKSALASFRNFGGYGSDVLLPADRREFNHCGGTDNCLQPLPPQAAFLPPGDPKWAVWRDWVFDTWTRFEEKLIRQMVLAQQGNPDFRGVIHFTTPAYYALPESSLQPITYKYIDSQENTVTVPNFDMTSHPEFERLNAVTSGVDMDRILSSPWFAGMVHETAAISVIPRQNGKFLFYEEADDFISNSERYRYFFNAQGALAKRAAQEQGKIFGAFTKSRWMLPDHDSTRPISLSHEYFGKRFLRSVGVLQPTLVSTIGPFYINGHGPTLPQQYQGAQFPVPPFEGVLEEPWCERMDCVDATAGGDYTNGFPFSFSEHPWMQTVEFGDSTVLHVKATGGSGNYAYTWLFSETNAPGSFGPLNTQTGFSGIFTPHLEIPVAGNDHEGYYRCRIFDLDGTKPSPSLISPVAKVTVLDQVRSVTAMTLTDTEVLQSLSRLELGSSVVVQPGADNIFRVTRKDGEGVILKPGFTAHQGSEVRIYAGPI